MNPIFSRRHRAGNGNSTSSQSASSQNKSTSPSKQQPDNDFVVKPLIRPPTNKQERSNKGTLKSHSPESYESYHIQRKPGISPSRLTTSRSLTFNTSFNSSLKSPSPVAESSKSFAQILLESKQNMLAGVSLTPKENRQRRSVNDSAKCPKATEKTISDATMTLCDIEDEDFGLDDLKPSYSGSFSRSDHCGNTSRNHLGTKKSLDLKTWRELKNIVVGSSGSLQGGWIGQGFSFDANIPFGIIQKKGGPCGVLAVVQALTLRNLIFGSEYCDEGLPVEIREENSSVAGSRTSTEFLFAQPISSKRTVALCGALVEILWKCAHRNDIEGDKVKSINGTSTPNSSAGCTVCFSGTSVGDDMRVFNEQHELREYIKENLYRLDCVGLLYSALLSRGLDAVQEDMDFPESPLLGQHGYCSQELVNLLLLGKAISNAFDDQILLGDKVLKGIESQSDVGLLSLFEHYDSCQVGSYLKNPKFPIWIVCSESHFSVLFSLDLKLSTETDMKKFDLYYYDGLSRQQSILKLSIGFQNDGSRSKSSYRYGVSGMQLNNNYDYQDEDLVPPLEKCIRTKWKNALVDWNGSEPIL